MSLERTPPKSFSECTTPTRHGSDSALKVINKLDVNVNKRYKRRFYDDSENSNDIYVSIEIYV